MSIKYLVLSIKPIKVAAFLLLATCYLLLATNSFAQCPEGQEETELGCISNTPLGFTKQLYGMGLGLVGGVGLLFIIYGSYLVLSSQGDPNQLSKGRSYIIFSIIGIVMAIAGFALYEIITIDILKLPGFSR